MIVSDGMIRYNAYNYNHMIYSEEWAGMGKVAMYATSHRLTLTRFEQEESSIEMLTKNIGNCMSCGKDSC